MEKFTGKFTSSDGKNNIAYYIWEPEKPRAVIQLSHGMCEYVERYGAHAEHFCSQGFVFAGNDHLGHGNSAADADELGYTVGADYMIDDLAKMTGILKEKYPGLPIILLGHSMGSFIARCYITKYGENLCAAIISGTAGPGNPTGFGKAVASLIGKKCGGHYRSRDLMALATGSYNKRFKGEGMSAWVSSYHETTDKYANDKFCNYIFTVNGYYNLFDLLGRVSKRSWADSVPKKLPVLLISGANDPVGNYGKGVVKVMKALERANVEDLTIKLYDGARHELLNERPDIRDDTYKFITDWISERIK